MKIICLSDTHGLHTELEPLPESDIILHAGDVTGRGEFYEVESFVHWLDRQPAKTKVFCCGNHDWLFEMDPGLAQRIINESESVVYLQDEMVEIDGLKIWGSPFQPWFYDWAFNFSQGMRGVKEAEEKWDLIPSEADIIITHGPPRGIGDLTADGVNTGCPILYEAIVKRIRPIIHLYGHIHEAYSINEIDDGAIVAINASNCNLQYQCVNPPIVIELEGRKVKSVYSL